MLLALAQPSSNTCLKHVLDEGSRVMQGLWSRLIRTSSTTGPLSLGKILAQKLSCPILNMIWSRLIRTSSTNGLPPPSPSSDSLPDAFRPRLVHTFTSLPFLYTFTLSHFHRCNHTKFIINQFTLFLL